MSVPTSQVPVSPASQINLPALGAASGAVSSEVTGAASTDAEHAPQEGAATLMASDWLASRPIYVNRVLRRVSHSIHDVYDPARVTFDSEGLRNYLSFGYSVFGQTPLRDVELLQANQRVVQEGDGSLRIETLPDPALPWFETRTRVPEVLDQLISRIRDWEAHSSGPIIVPTSGGLDSRLLNAALADKSRIRAYSYGLGPKQERNFQVVYASVLAEKLGLDWQHVPLGKFHHELDAWYALYGCATHAHGMYQLEFYRQIRGSFARGTPLLSGIIGDLWAGSVDVPPLSGPDDLETLGYRHGMFADGARCLLPNIRTRREAYWERERERLRDGRYRALAVARLKLGLLSYLMEVPRALGFEPWSPFLEVEPSMAMMMLPDAARTDRVWQREWFAAQGLDLERQSIPRDERNTLNLDAVRQVPLRALREDLLREVIDPRYVRWVNRTVRSMAPPHDRWWRLRAHWRFGRFVRMLPVRDDRRRAYHAYLTLWPIDELMRRQQALGAGAAPEVTSCEACRDE